MPEPFVPESYRAHRQRLVIASLGPAAAAIVATTLIYAAADCIQSGSCSRVPLAHYLMQLAIPFVALGLVWGRLRDQAELVALGGDLAFTVVLVTQLLSPASTISGVTLMLSIKMLATALFFPWSARIQYVSATASTLIYWVLLVASGRALVLPAALHQVLGPLVALVLSAAGAASADRTRRALFLHERNLQQEARVASGLARVGQALISTLGTPALLKRLCEVTNEVLECDSSHTLLWEPAESAFVVAAGDGYSPEEWEAIRVVKVNRDTLAGATAQLGRQEVNQFTVPELPEPGWQGMAGALGISGIMGMALRRGGETVGMHCACYRGRSQRFTSQQERIGRGIAQLGTLALENARLVEELEAGSRVKSEFVATISHELRNPLNIIMGYCDLLLDRTCGELTAEQADMLQRMERGARQLFELITATLDLSRIEAGRLPLEVKRVAVRDLVEEVEVETRELCEKPGLRFSSHVAADLGELRTDPLKLKVVLKNLIGNAVKFTNEGSVRLEARGQDGGVEFRVADTGIGIPPDALARIFDAFRQAGSSSGRRYGGVGLGLYIVRRLVEILGGKVAVESSMGEGSTFRIWMPRDIGTQQERGENDRADVRAPDAEKVRAAGT